MSARVTSLDGDAPRWRGRGRAIALGVAAATSGAGLLAASGWLIARAAERPPVLALLTMIVVVRALGLVRAFGRYGERLASHDLAFRRLAALRVAWYRRLVARPPTAGAPAAADLLSRFVNDVDELQHREARVAIPATVAVVASLGATAVAALILPAAGVALGAGLLVAGTVVPATAYLAAHRALRRQGAARAALADELTEALDAAPQLAIAGRAPERLARLDAASAALTRIARRDAAGAALAEGLGTLVAGATLVAVVAVAAAPVADGRLAPVWLAALALLALGAFEPVAALPEAAVRAVGVRAAERRLRAAVAEGASDGRPASDATAATATRGATSGTAATAAAVARGTLPLPDGPLVARDIRHRPGGAGASLVLDGVDLTLAPGRRIAIVGASGAGKTVLAHVLAGLTDPDEGEVTVGGVPIAQADPSAVRERIRLAGQDAHLFATSIANNVRVGAPDADDAAVEAALRATGLGPWLDALPDGIDTLVGEEGTVVSGGQRQRIALARCLVSPARLLLLDEPTAMLDPPAAQALIADLAHAADDRGVLLITHERIGLDAFDEVLELRDGQLRRTDG